jgi:hypothetical protein
LFWRAPRMRIARDVSDGMRESNQPRMRRRKRQV